MHHSFGMDGDINQVPNNQTTGTPTHPPLSYTHANEYKME